MRAMTEKSIRSPRKLALELGVVLGIVTVLAMVLYPIFAGTTICYIRYTCLSNLKQLGTAVAIYQSDADDNLPPFYTFDGKKTTEQFVAATMPYAKDEGVYKCYHDREGLSHSEEQTSTKMTFVHAIGMKTLIPSYRSGNRTLRVPDSIPNLGATLYMRDPIQGFGTSTLPGGESSEPGYLSLHGSGFCLLFLDSHGKFKRNIVDQSEL